MSSRLFNPILDCRLDAETSKEFDRLWESATEERQNLFIAMQGAGLLAYPKEKRVDDLRQILAGKVAVEGADVYPTLEAYGRYMFDATAWKYLEDPDYFDDSGPRDFYDALIASIDYEAFGRRYLEYGEGFDPNGTVKGKIVKNY